MANEFKVKNGIKFQDGTIQTTAATGGGGGGSSAITISDAAPGSPTAGMPWWDSTVGSLRIYYNDGTSSQWVDAFNAQGNAGVDGKSILNGTVDPTTQGLDGDFYINTATKYFFGPKAAGTWPAGTYMLGTTLVSVGTTPPTSPLNGSTWWDSNLGKLFISYNDGTSTQWVGVANDPGTDGIGVAIGGTIGQALVKNSNTDYDTTWTSIIPSSGVTISAGKFNTSATNPTNTTRLNYEGNFYATSLNGSLTDTYITYTSRAANLVLAAPNNVAGAPTFRNLTLEDLPDAWIKESVKCATTANITLSGTQTIDGVAVVAGDRVLVKNQTSAATNGIYVVAASTWARSFDASVTSELAGAIVAVDTGTVNGGLSFDCDLKTTDTLGTTVINWNRVLDTGYLSTVGNSFATLTNPSAVTFPRINADNTVSALDAATFRTAIGASAGGSLYYRLNTAVVGANGITAQNVLGVGVTLATSTVYEFEAYFNLFKSAGTTSHTFSFGWGGTATINNIATNILIVESANGYVTLAGKTLNHLTLEAATQTVLTAAMATAFRTVNLRVRGTVSVNAGGTFIPQYQLSAAPGGAYTSSVGNYMKITPIGTAGSNSILGTWA